MGALVIVVTVYVLVAIAGVGAQQLEEFSSPDQQDAGLSVILENITGSAWPGTILAAGAVISIFSVTLVTLYGQTRILFAMGRDRMQVEAERGVNPFKHGIISFDQSHDGTPSDAAAEDNFAGHAANNDGTPEFRLGLKPNPAAAAAGVSAADDPTKFFNPGAIAGVWAKAPANTREAIWDALQREGTFGTSGTRTKIRLMGGFDFPPDLGGRPDWVKVGYRTGVPQGGDLKAAPADKAPAFVAWALRDPDSAPLARLQIIKGFVDGKQAREMTYDVACSDGGKPDSKSHRCPDNGATVNLDDCSISTDKGASELVATWSDPDFKPGERAFYYARVLGEPGLSLEHVRRQARGFAYPKELPKTVKERAWSSPIWYTP